MTTTTYHPTVMFDIPAADPPARAVIDATDLEVHQNTHYSDRDEFAGDVSPDLEDAVRTAIDAATKGAVDVSRPLDIERIARGIDRLEIVVHFTEPEGEVVRLDR